MNLKLLSWEPIFSGPRRAKSKEPNNWSCLLPFGEFWIEKKIKFWLSWEGRREGHFDSLEEAQAKANWIVEGWVEELMEKEEEEK